MHVMLLVGSPSLGMYLGCSGVGFRLELGFVSCCLLFELGIVVGGGSREVVSSRESTYLVRSSGSW